jgi:hypothetical protein
MFNLSNQWKLKKTDSDVLERLTCCLARSLLIYIGTPMAAVGLWKRKEIDQCEASIYRKILGLPRHNELSYPQHDDIHEVSR